MHWSVNDVQIAWSLWDPSIPLSPPGWAHPLRPPLSCFVATSSQPAVKADNCCQCHHLKICCKNMSAVTSCHKLLPTCCPKLFPNWWDWCHKLSQAVTNLLSQAVSKLMRLMSQAELETWCSTLLSKASVETTSKKQQIYFCQVWQYIQIFSQQSPILEMLKNCLGIPKVLISAHNPRSANTVSVDIDGGRVAT